YEAGTGWNPSSRGLVPVVHVPRGDAEETAPLDESTGDDPATFTGAWVTLDAHLADAARAARAILAEARMSGLRPEQCEAAVVAASLHDLGKAHPVFQDTLVRSAADEVRGAVERLVPLAKSGSVSRPRHRRPHFRHELVSALLLADGSGEVLVPAHVDRSLVRYLVAAHHGRVRLAIRSIPGEVPPADHGATRVALGVVEGDVVPAFSVGGTPVEESTLSLGAMEFGGDGSWTAMALGLRDRDDLGPFRLATLEALVRIADWRASAAPTAASLGSER
ncbi:MAG: CRISPR-associated endonuclease Cas3'', partial [Chloroflexi bacterium]|nr:CRISPR-associated endonuclease Cas3'' [Chloroflexota bacterium]